METERETPNGYMVHITDVLQPGMSYRIMASEYDRRYHIVNIDIDGIVLLRYYSFNQRQWIHTATSLEKLVDLFNRKELINIR